MEQESRLSSVDGGSWNCWAGELSLAGEGALPPGNIFLLEEPLDEPLAIWNQPKYPQEGIGSGSLWERCDGGGFNGTEICLLFIVKWNSVLNWLKMSLITVCQGSTFYGKDLQDFFLIWVFLKKNKRKAEIDKFSVVTRKAEIQWPPPPPSTHTRLPLRFWSEVEV